MTKLKIYNYDVVFYFIFYFIYIFFFSFEVAQYIFFSLIYFSNLRKKYDPQV